jgi:hypothetical protein
MTTITGSAEVIWAPPQPQDPLGRLAVWSVTGARGLGLWLLVHVPLSVLIFGNGRIAAAHAGFVLLLGIWAALRWQPHNVLLVVCYVAGGEVLWRMSRAPIPWEFGKYAVILILLLVLVRNGRRLVFPALPIAYLLLLLPSVALTWDFFRPDLNAARVNALGNISGPISLMAAVWFCSVFPLKPVQVTRAMIVAIAPIFGVAVVTALNTYGSNALRFGNASNFATSGGFGPNQVSSMLGLGALLCLLVLLRGRTGTMGGVILAGTMLLLIAQSAMTFSRGGLYGAFGAAALGAFFLLRDGRTAARLFLVSAIVVVLSTFFLVPRLDSFTGGALSARFGNTESTGRTTLMKIDLELWKQNVVFGIGPGVSKFNREDLGYRQAAAHTEQTRLLAEHGLLGLGALCALLLMGLSALRGARTPLDRAQIVTLMSWSILVMLHSAMRVAAVGFVFGLAFAIRSPPIPRVNRQVSPATLSRRTPSEEVVLR